MTPVDGKPRRAQRMPVGGILGLIGVTPFALVVSSLFAVDVRGHDDARSHKEGGP